jgi:hypothetical protein
MTTSRQAGGVASTLRAVVLCLPLLLVVFGAVFAAVQAFDRLLATSEERVAVVEVESVTATRNEPTGRSERVVQRVTGVSENGTRFSFDSPEFVSAAASEVPVAGVGSAGAVSGRIVQAEVAGVTMGGGAGSGVVWMLVAVIAVAVLALMPVLVLRASGLTPRVIGMTVVVLGAVASLVITMSIVQPDKASPGQLELRNTAFGN